MLTQEIAQKFLASLIALPEVMRLLSAEHFLGRRDFAQGVGVDEELQPKDGLFGLAAVRPPRNGETDFRKTKRSKTRYARLTDDGQGCKRLFRKAEGQESRLAYLGHALMENRNGLIVAAEATLATGTAEREAAAAFSERLPKGATLGADKNL